MHESILAPSLVLEQPVKKDILATLKGLGILAWDNRSNTRRGRMVSSNKGTADILGILRGGRLLAVEVKKPGAKLRKDQPDQDQWLQKADALGALVIRAESVGQVLDVLKREGYLAG